MYIFNFHHELNKNQLWLFLISEVSDSKIEKNSITQKNILSR